MEIEVGDIIKFSPKVKKDHYDSMMKPEYIYKVTGCLGDLLFFMDIEALTEGIGALLLPRKKDRWNDACWEEDLELVEKHRNGQSQDFARSQ